MEERRQAWRIHPAHSPALYMFDSAAAHNCQPLRPRSTLAFRRRGIRGREEAKKRGRAEPIARGDRPVIRSMRTSASPARMTSRARVDGVRVTSHGSEGAGMCFLPNPTETAAGNILCSCCAVRTTARSRSRSWALQNVRDPLSALVVCTCAEVCVHLQH